MAAGLASTLPATIALPLVDDEIARAEALDRLCAELDMQIGITVRRSDAEPITGTRLRGVAEANGFRLAADGRYEWLPEDSPSVLYTLQNLSGEPFSNDMLRTSALTGLVFVLDVPCVAHPARVFDQMKLAAARMAKALGGEMIDDNRRALTEESLARTRAQIAAAGEALTRASIEPGSARALQLFSA
jgi:FtsZ-interacting cell division protein ZipA